MKNNKRLSKLKVIIPSLITALAVIFSLILAGIPNSKADDVTVQKIETQCGYLEYEKSAEALGNDKYKISFNIKSTLKEAVKKKADIVLLIDTSGSMGRGDTDIWGNWHDYGNKIENIKTSAKSLCDTLITTNSDIDLGIVTFGSKAENYLSLTSLNSDSRAGIENSIDNIQAEGATNTEDGIDYAGRMLNEARGDSDKYLILFTDGYPTMSTKSIEDRRGFYYYDGRILFDTGSSACDVFFKDAQNRYNSYFGGISSVGGLGFDIKVNGWNGDYWDVQSSIGSETAVTPQENAPLKDTKIYSIGCLTQVSDDDALKNIESGPKFLYSIQNAESDYNSYKAKYFTENQTDINNIFDNIANDIRTELISYSAENVSVKDIVSDKFKIPEDVQFQISKEGINVNRISESEINIEIGNLGEETVNVSFIVDAKDPYYSRAGEPTNNRADLDYSDPKDPNHEKKSVLFNEPSVDIEPKVGTLIVSKNVNNPNNLKMQDESFLINLKHNDTGEVYNIRLENGETESMSFFLRNVNTDIRYNYDYSKNYFTIGTYTVNEIVPMNYAIDSVKIKVNGNEVSGNTFTIDKNNSNVSIEVINNLDNDKYWWNKDYVNNSFPYVYEHFSMAHEDAEK